MFDNCHNKNNTLKTIRRLLAQILKTFEVKLFYVNSVNKQPYALYIICFITEFTRQVTTTAVLCFNFHKYYL